MRSITNPMKEDIQKIKIKQGSLFYFGKGAGPGVHLSGQCGYAHVHLKFTFLFARSWKFLFR